MINASVPHAVGLALCVVLVAVVHACLLYPCAWYAMLLVCMQSKLLWIREELLAGQGPRLPGQVTLHYFEYPP
jgi:hypothetical protein